MTKNFNTSSNKTNENTLQKIESTIAQALRRLGAMENVTKNTKLSDCALDSLNYSELVIILERELDVRISFKDEHKYFCPESTVGDIVKYIQQLQNNNSDPQATQNAPVSEKNIQIVKLNNTDIQFRNGNTVLNLIDPKISNVLQKMKKELEYIK